MRLSFRHKNLLMAVFTALLAFSYVNSTMCWHTHVIGDEIIVHSHLFGRSANAQQAQGDGGHTPGQLRMIQEANELVYTDDSVLPDIPLMRIDVLQEVFFSVPAVLSVQRPQVAVRSLRAPPGL
jgi:hypothetical protein